MKIWCLILASFLLSCSSHRNVEFFLLHPIQEKMVSKKPLKLRIGIDAIHLPVYFARSEMVLMTSGNQIIESNKSEWIEPLSKNISRVIANNLTNLFPGSVVMMAPRDIYLQPNCHLDIDIIRFSLDDTGKSTLEASWLVYRKKGKGNTYRVRLRSAGEKNDTMSQRVFHMNQNLNTLSRKIAYSLENDCG